MSSPIVIVILFLLIVLTTSSFLPIPPRINTAFPNCQRCRNPYNYNRLKIQNYHSEVVFFSFRGHMQQDGTQDEPLTDRSDTNYSYCPNRRNILRSLSSRILGISLLTNSPSKAEAVLIPSPIPPPTTTTDTTTTPESERIYQLTSGLQFRNIRIGEGPPISRQRADDDPIALHLRATTINGKELFDTKAVGTPLLYSIGTTQDFDTFGGDSSARPKVTQGVEDTILSRGLLMGGDGGDGGGDVGSREMEPMREGGIRRVLVPASLAYGNTGVSRYDAFRMGLKNPVPRNGMIVYQIELLRCLSVDLDVPGDASEGGVRSESFQACCTQDSYPCAVPKQGRE